MEIATLGGIFLVGIVAGFVGGLMSGGGSLLVFPFLIFLGLPPHMAIATERFGSFGYVASTIYKFAKSKKIVFTYVVPLSIVSVIGGIIGANLVVNIDKELLIRIIGIAILLFLPIILFKKDLGIERRKIKSTAIILLGFFLYFLSAIYDGFLGAAGGIIVAYLFVFVFGLTYIQANATDKIPFAFNALISTVIFASNGLINYQYGAALLAGELIGGYLGAQLAVNKGDKLVRVAFIIASSASAIKLLFF